MWDACARCVTAASSRASTQQSTLRARGRPLQAVITIRLTGHDRAQVEAFGNEIAALPGVLSAHNISGADDFLVHVTAESPDQLRDFVLDNISSRAGVGHVQTSLVFRSHAGSANP